MGGAVGIMLRVAILVYPLAWEQVPLKMNHAPEKLLPRVHVGDFSSDFSASASVLGMPTHKQGPLGLTMESCILTIRKYIELQPKRT